MEREPSQQSDDDFEGLLAAVAAAPDRHDALRLVPGDMFASRYQVVRALGQGGMGIVYLCRDTDLDRNVALKLALERPKADEWQRLQKEAKAMARLSHPSVVGVYEVGEYSGHVFIAMEFVPGMTLRDWMDLESRDWRDVARLFVAIARGLDAAHQAAVVHRDFKPDNVLVGLDGAPRIADFGLARLQVGGAAPPTPDPSVDLDDATTSSGAIVGTPAYMAPEQVLGRGATPKSDQFSFFVTLFEALHGTRPFPGRSHYEILSAIEEGRTIDVGSSPRVPGPLSRMITRGLSLEPEERHASMAEVAAEVEAILTRGRRRLLLGGLTLAGLAAAGVGFASATAVEPAPCEGSGDNVAEIWNEQARAELPTDRQWPNAVAAVDAYAADLVQTQHAACERYRVEEAESHDAYELQLACFTRVRGRLAALVDELGAAARRTANVDGSIVDRTLPPPTECRDTDALRRAANRWSETSLRDSVQADAAYAAAHAKLTTAIARVWTEASDADQSIDDVARLAEANDLVDIQARVALLRADLERDHAAAAKQLEKAAGFAADAGDTTLLADIVTQQAQHAALSGDHAAASLLLDHADQLSELAVRNGRPRSDEVTRTLVRAQLALARDQPAKAIDPLQSVLGSLPAADPRRLDALGLLGRARLGADDLDGAVESFESALALAGGASPLARHTLHVNLGITLRARGEFSRAREAFERAGQELDQVSPPSPLHRANLLNNRGRLDRLVGEREQAMAAQQQAQAVVTEVDPNHADLAFIFDELGQLHLEAGRLDEARSTLGRAGEIRDATLGPRNLPVAHTLTLLGRVEIEAGRTERAAGALGLALAILDEHGAGNDQKAEPTFELARAKRELGATREALELASSARDACRDSPYAACRTLVRQRIDPWLRDVSPPTAPP